MRNICLIDDDEKLGKLLRDYVSQFDMSLTSYTHPSTGLAAIENQGFELLILDIMLPQMDGFSVCKEIRQHAKYDNQLPIIMLTARGEVTDRILGIELGADDYLAKPFEPRELVARIENILRRRTRQKKHSDQPPENNHISCNGIEIDLKKQHVLLDHQPLNLTTMEYELLLIFLSSAGSLLTRQDLMNHLRGIDAELFSRAVDTLVSRLRHKLNDTSRNPRFIKTVWGRGYVFLGSTT